MHPSSRFLVPTLTILNWSIAAAFGSPSPLIARVPASIVNYRNADLSKRQIHNADFSTSTTAPLVGAKPESLNSTMPGEAQSASRPIDTVKGNTKTTRSIEEEHHQLPNEHAFSKDPSNFVTSAPGSAKVVGRVVEGSRRWFPVKRKEALPVVPSHDSTTAKPITGLFKSSLGNREVRWSQTRKEDTELSPEIARTAQENHRLRMQRHTGIGLSANEHIPRDVFKPDSQRLARELVKHELNPVPVAGAREAKDERHDFRGYVGRWTLRDKRALETKKKLRAEASP
ncbi:hypothetical protein Hypma_002645 [Hypsizygus marmoreus]|uniref:Uncharacterized protein n=1 Tax=Hypsizygus marmoreus TaxID=39966 RepID=A0A369J6L1_HYPMA|nr:hypothetical protein Hypma_002645 [Hypsizygus marmoreus]